MSTEQENNKVTLYIATHNKTSLKYFGKTTKYFTQEELQKYYHGSGKYWKNHIKKHSDDVTMEIYGIYNLDKNSEDYVEPIALKFSEKNNIVEDYNTWVNQIPENGLDGYEGGSMQGKKHSEETKKKMSKIHKGKVIKDESKSNLEGYITRYGEIEGTRKYKENNKKKVVTLETQIEKYGEVEGTKRWKNLLKKKSDKTSGKNNSFYGKTYTDEMKKNSIRKS